MSTHDSSGIIRVQKKDNYSVINNTPINDSRLSWQARGMLCYLLSKPDNWETRLHDLIGKSPAGEDAVKSIISELKHFGYVERIRERQKEGTFVWITKIHELPIHEQNASFKRRQRNKTETGPQVEIPPVVKNSENPLVDFPLVDKPPVDEPRLENPAIYINTELESTDLKNTDLQNPHSLFESQKNKKPGAREVLSKFSYEEWYDYTKYCKEVLGEPIDSIEAVAESNYYKGIRDSRLESWKNEQTKKNEKPILNTDEIKTILTFCPKCYGAGSEIVPGRGARKCDHSGLSDRLTAAVVEGEIDFDLKEKYQIYVKRKAA